MAVDTGHDHDEGNMDIGAHRKTWSGFVAFTKWSVIGILVVMVLLLIFRTN